MKFLFLMAAAVAALLPVMSWGATDGVFATGGTVENGGDIILCKDFPKPGAHSTSGEYEEFKAFNLDYVLAVGSGVSTEYFSPIDSWDNSMNRIGKILLKTSITMLAKFHDFAVSTRKINLSSFSENESSTRKWKKKNTIIRVEQPAGTVFPENCKWKKIIEGNEIVITGMYYRVVVRESSEISRKLTYHYHPLYLQYLLENDPLQFSFMMVHEWLWDFTSSAVVNRNVNAFLHSREIEVMSSQEIRERLIHLGLRF